MEARPLKDLPINNNLMVNFNWECNSECDTPARTIRDTVLITYEGENEKHKIEDYNDIIDINRTVNVVPPLRCTTIPIPILTFTVSEVENFYISQLCIICDCKIIEVFGEQDIYLDSIHGEVLDENDSFRACQFQVDLSSKVNKRITINFLKLLNSDQKHLWIFGIHLTLKPMSRQNINSSICFDNVQELLKNTTLSDKAARCMKFVQESMTNPQFNMSERKSTSIANLTQLEGQDLDKLISELKQYIDHKFLVLNEFLILRERNLHDKIDLILDHIKSQKRN